MKKIRLGIIAPSEIAIRRFLPALEKQDKFIFSGVSVASWCEWSGDDRNQYDKLVENDIRKAKSIIDQYGGIIYSSYTDLIDSPTIDAVYIPLPPALHYEWAKRSLSKGKHVLVEKPFTTSHEDTLVLIELAKNNKLAVHENYMFKFHKQIDFINGLLKRDKIGEVRDISIQFGFPFRGVNDFRYNKKLGGGALLDCGGYTIKLATMLLGDTSRLKYAKLKYVSDFEVDIYGTGNIQNNSGESCSISFGMDNSYRCSLNIWGSKGYIFTNRIFTAPHDYFATVEINENGDTRTITIEPDDSFLKSIEYFGACISNETDRNKNYNEIIIQSKLMAEFIIKSKGE